MFRHPALRCLGLGLLLTLGQVALAVGFAHPEGSWRDRYLTLVQHDSYWFANIIDRGYGTTLPPIDHKEMEVSNVAFFPAYPLLTKGVKLVTGLGTYPALLVTAQAATWGFWTYFFLFGTRWGLSMTLQAFGALAIAAHPAAFYLVAGYSESLFLMALTGFIYWSSSPARGARALAVLHGFVMSATRIVGLPLTILPVVQRALARWRRRDDGGVRLAQPPLHRALVVTCLSLLGGLAFFAYCQVRWGRWDLYLLTQQAGWAIAADYLAVFKITNYRFALPPVYDTSRMSQLASALAGAVFVAIALLELVAARWRRSDWRNRLGLYFAAAVIYYISLAGVASVQMESMLRYDLCVHALIVLGLLHFLREFRMLPVLLRASAMGVAALVFAGGLWLQVIYVWNFTQGNWVA